MVHKDKGYPYAAPIRRIIFTQSEVSKQTLRVLQQLDAIIGNRITVGFYQKKEEERCACRGPGAVQDHDMLIVVMTSGW